MNLLPSADKRAIVERSSIDQFEGFLGMTKQGKVVPIIFDVLESASCTTLRTHKAMLCLDESYKGFLYPLASCRQEIETVLLTDRRGLVTKEIPCSESLPAKTYDEYLDDYAVAKADNNFVGVRNKVTFRVGLNYYQALDSLPSADVS